MSRQTERAAAWVYRGVWGVLAGLFKVPTEPPTLPAAAAIGAESVRPAPGFLRYLKFKFWLVLLLFDFGIIAGWIAISFASPIAGAITFLPVMVIAIVPDIFAYVAIHLRYDTTWYVISNRSMRIRRGIWTIHETTITFENVQNVTVRQGPLQRHYGIADVVVQTAGGGGAHGGKGEHGGLTHVGLLEGLADAERVRDLILARTTEFRGAGLGDERHVAEAAGEMWTVEHLAVLREIRALARAGA